MWLQLFGDPGAGAIDKLIDQVADQGDKAVDDAGSAADKAVDKVEDVLDKAESVLLDPKATGAQKKEVLEQLEEILPQLMEVTDKWFTMEAAVAELKAKAFIGQPTGEAGAAPGTATVDSSQGPLQLEDKTAPLEIPVPAVQTSPTPSQGSGLSRLWKSLW